MKVRFAFLLVVFTSTLFAQSPVTTSPMFATENDSIIIYFDATKGDAGLMGFTGDVYAHTGVITNLSTSGSDWKYVMAPWAATYPDIKLTRDSADHYHLVIGRPRIYYGNNHQNLGSIPSSEHILKLAFVFRDATGSRTGRDVGGKDIFASLYTAGISIIVQKPAVGNFFGDLMRSPVFISPGGTIPILVNTSEVGTKTKLITLFVNGTQKAQSTTNSLNFTYSANDYPRGRNDVKIVAADTANLKDSTSFVIFRNPTVKDAPLPAGNQIGINYHQNDHSKVTLALYAPFKNFVYVLGDFNDWKVDTTYYMNRYEVRPDSVIWWITLSNLTAGQEYAYQFLVDGTIRVQDPYTDKILDPWNDQYISSSTYPNLKPYPTGKTEGIVSVLQTGQTPYNWNIQNFMRPSKDKLVIYELLVRDFVTTHSYTTLKDTLSYFKKLGVNAIELMPINEFEGNSSWGYNPMMYFAPDKYYGTKDQLKAFIDACHQNGIAVIMDIVLNHSYGLSPMVRMYWDTTNARPAANNPWFNQVSPNTTFSWGYDFNHESAATKYFVDRVTSYWLTEYKMDGFRFDFSKGFTNTPGDGSAYDAKRIAILERIADKIWNVSPNAYVILEHFCANTEETQLANYGMMLWGNLNGSYQQAAMGYPSGPPGTWDFSWISYLNRGWNSPGLVGYMESHDEERLMFKNLQYGNSNGSYNIKNLSTALDRIKLCATLFLTVPGPKMIWMGGEVGYNVSIDSSGRISEKPFKWNYYADSTHKKLFNVFAGLIRLKKAYPAFSSSNFTISASASTKSIHITDTTMNATILGNFDVVAQNITPAFQNTGKWYEFFTGDSIDVSDVNAQIDLQPGEYRLYTTVKIPKLDADIPEQTSLPAQYYLSQNYPNPFNSSTVISYQLPVAGYVTLKVYDVLGREVATLINQVQNTGNYKVEFDSNQFHLSSGVYFYRIETDKFVQSKKMILLK
ncbi:MAG: alpha-amylase family glycosyl hydrolase [Bacteroidetes bacterium]|nr:alpha-amylase family glycosyl hydrolase [Bacteroidota bacterium]